MSEDLSNILTPEEISAMNGTDVADDDIDALKAVAGNANLSDDEEDDDDDDDGGDGGDGQPVEGKGAADTGDDDADKVAAKTAGDPATGAATAQDDDDQGDDEDDQPIRNQPFIPKYEARLPENYAQTIADLKSAEDDLKAKFKAGDIEFDEFEEQRAQIQSQRETLNSAKLKAEISQEMGQQTAQQTWQNTVNTYLTAVRKEVDYFANEDLATDLDGFVKQLANNPKHANRDMTWFLAEADKRVRALHDLAPRKAAKATEKKPDELPNRKPNLDKAPKSLAQVPGGDGPGDVEGEFAHLDNLEGDELEAAIAKMTPAQREKFARS